MRKLVHVMVLAVPMLVAAGGCAHNVYFMTSPVLDSEPYETGFLGPMSAETRIDIGSITIANTSNPPTPLEVVVYEVILALREKSPRKDITPGVGKPGEPRPEKSDCLGPRDYAGYRGDVARVRVPAGETVHLDYPMPPRLPVITPPPNQLWCLNVGIPGSALWWSKPLPKSAPTGSAAIEATIVYRHP